MSQTKEQLIAEAKTFTHDELAEYYAEVCVEREKTVSNLRAALEHAEQKLLILRRQQIDAAKAQLAKLEAL